MKNTKKMTGSVQSLTFSRRATLLGGASLGIGAVLLARMGYIAVVENSRFKLLSESNRVNFTLIPPRRGWLLDRNEKPIANNKADFRVDLNPSRVKDKETTVATLSKLLRLDTEEVRRINTELAKTNNFQPIHIASGLDLDSFAAVTVRLPDLPGVSASRGFSRNYPPGAAVGHLVGYVGTPSAEEYEQDPSPILVTPGYKIGKDGLEKKFEAALQGKPGAKRVEVTARGKIVRELEARPDIPGKSIQLTLDIDVQRYAARRLGEESGSVVVLDSQTGEILTITSMPSFDPNSFSDGISQNEWQMLSGDDHVPLRDKSLRGLYPPGSTIKPMVALALLKEGVRADETIFCTGRLKVGNSFFHCWKRGGHGTVNMAKAIYQSCDVYFYQMALRVGIEPIAAMAKTLGLGLTYDLPVSSQSYGTVPDAQWKERKYNRKWQAYDTVNTTIGQGYMLANPLQLAIMAARIASGRNIVPSLLPNKNKRLPQSLDLSPEHLAFVRSAMGDVVSEIGTARRAALPIPDVKMGGKTGTAQVRRITMAERAGGVRSNASLPWKFRDHGLFVAFAPVENPRYAISVVVEHGGGSGSAYPIARDVMTFLYKQEIAMDALRKLEADWGGDIEERMAKRLAEYKASKTVTATD
jgi:penicillin-binding protein 2